MSTNLDEEVGTFLGQKETAKKEQKRIQESQEALNAKQHKKEQQRLAEADDELARRELGTQQGGRKSLIKSSPTGLATNLGGTVNA